MKAQNLLAENALPVFKEKKHWKVFYDRYFSLPLKAPKLYEEFIDKIRGFYKRLGYTEVFTPYIQDEPNLEKYIKPVEIDITYCSKKKKRIFIHPQKDL
jgi:hypothetical protein